MTFPKFEYVAAKTVEEACNALKDRGEDARVIAGGTDLLIKLRYGLLAPRLLIGLKKIDRLDRILFDQSQGLTIGATALLADAASHPDILKHYPAVAGAAQETANVQIRNMGTVVGNLCNAAPSADNAPALLALDAEVSVSGPGGTRRLPLEQFFMGPGLTVLEPGEIVTEIHVPTPPPGSGTSFQHISPRSKVDISAVAVGVTVEMDGEFCKDVKIALAAVFPTPMRATKSEESIKGEKLTADAVAHAALQAAKECKPITDVRASAEYRRQMVTVLTKRGLVEARERALRS